MRAAPNGWLPRWLAHGPERGDAVTLTPTYSSKGTCFYPLSDKVELAWLADIAGTRASGAMAAFKRLMALRKHIRDTKPDVVVSFLTNVNVAAILATRGLRVPLIVCERTNPVAETTRARCGASCAACCTRAPTW